MEYDLTPILNAPLYELDQFTMLVKQIKDDRLTEEEIEFLKLSKEEIDILQDLTDDPVSTAAERMRFADRIPKGGAVRPEFNLYKITHG